MDTCLRESRLRMNRKIGRISLERLDTRCEKMWRCSGNIRNERIKTIWTLYGIDQGSEPYSSRSAHETPVVRA